MSKNTKDILKFEQVQPGILRLTLNDPESKNALSKMMMI